MGIMDLIENLRERSARERERWAISVAIGVTLFIFLVWLALFMARISTFSQTPASPSNLTTTTHADTPFGTVSQSVKHAWKGFQDSISNLGSVHYHPHGV